MQHAECPPPRKRRGLLRSRSGCCLFPGSSGSRGARRGRSCSVAAAGTKQAGWRRAANLGSVALHRMHARQRTRRGSSGRMALQWKRGRHAPAQEEEARQDFRGEGRGGLHRRLRGGAARRHLEPVAAHAAGLAAMVLHTNGEGRATRPGLRRPRRRRAAAHQTSAVGCAAGGGRAAHFRPPASTPHVMVVAANVAGLLPLALLLHGCACSARLGLRHTPKQERAAAAPPPADPAPGAAAGWRRKCVVLGAPTDSSESG